MLRTVVFGIAMAMPVAGMAQVKVDTLAFPPGTKYAESYKLPVVSGLSPDAAARINTYIQYSQLKLIPGHYPNPIFTEENTRSGTTSLAFEVARADSHLVTITVMGEYMGAYPSSGSTWLSFDAHTGQPVSEANLFTPAGKAFVQRNIDQRLAAGVKDTLKDLAKPAPPGAPTKDSEGDDYVEMQTRTYSECVDGLATMHYFELHLAGEVSVTRGCSFPHVIQALDDLGDVEWKASYAKLAPQMTAYGKCLLVDQKDTCTDTAAEPGNGVWRGTIGKGTAITFVGTAYDIAYFYDRYGKALALSKEDAPAGHWVFTQRDDKNITLETFDLTRAPAGGFVGTWTQTGKAPLPVVLR